MKNKGFTLIELLAVIVILAIILAIAVPSISSIIKSSAKAAFESDAKLVLKAIDYEKLDDRSLDITSLTEANIKSNLGLSNDNYSSLSIILEEDIPIISIVGKNKWDGLIACGSFDTMKIVTSLSDCSNDVIQPVITLNGNATVSINQDDIYTDLGATALDNKDGNVTSKIVVTSNINPSIPGIYTVTYAVTDMAGNKGTATRTVNVIDNVSPTISFSTNGNSTYAKTRSTTVTITDVGGLDVLKYLWNTSTTTPIELSFTNVFANGGSIVSPSSVTGSYYLWILGKDKAGNTKISRSNAFNLDNTIPVITITGTNPITINKGSTYTDQGATATDNIDATVTVASTGSVNPNVVGTYTITYDATDSSGNIAVSKIRTINVVDAQAPVITLNGSTTVNLEIKSTYTDAGATALDDIDGNVTSKITTTSNVNPNVMGTYNVTYTVKDNANNTATATRVVNVVDTVAPAIASALSGSYINTDATFSGGTNGAGLYNNSGDGTVTVNRTTISGAPEGSGYGLTIKTTAGTSSPGFGGFTFGTPSAANKVYITRLVAKIPVGYNIQWASNAIGTGGYSTWLTSQNGTGDWKEYIVQVNTGSTGTFGDTNYFYLADGAIPTVATPLVWYVAYGAVMDTTKWATSNNIIFKASDSGSGIIGYGINQSSTAAPTFTSISNNNEIGKIFTNINTNGTYYVWVKDLAGNVSNKAVSVNYADTVSPTITTTINSNISFPFSSWTLSGGTYINASNQLVLPNNGAIAISPFLPVNGTQWTFYANGYTNSVSPAATPNGAVLLGSIYYNSSYQIVKSLSGYESNGYAPSIPIGQTIPITWDGWAGYGPDVIYVRIQVTVDNYYSVAPAILSNVRFEASGNSNYQKIITLTAVETQSGIKTRKWLAGAKTASDFASTGTVFTDKFYVNTNGIYTIYVEDNAGNNAVSQVTISGIN